MFTFGLLLSPPIALALHQQSPTSLLPRAADIFPAFGSAVFPVDRVPDWGIFTTPRQWDRRAAAIKSAEWIALPAYDLTQLQEPLDDLLEQRDLHHAALTAKLTYSTRHLGAYDLDAGEFSGRHAGIDIKLPLDTLVRAIGGGRVLAVREDRRLGKHVLIEHRVNGESYVSIYGHLGETLVRAGQDLTAGTTIGMVGQTGRVTAPHLHLQLDRMTGKRHLPYAPQQIPTRTEAQRWTVQPIAFILAHQAQTKIP